MALKKNKVFFLFLKLREEKPQSYVVRFFCIFPSNIPLTCPEESVLEGEKTEDTLEYIQFFILESFHWYIFTFNTLS